MDVVLCCFNLNTKAIKWSTYRDAHPRWCEVSKSPGFWLKLWPDSNQDFLSKLKLVWRFHIFFDFWSNSLKAWKFRSKRTFSQREKPWLSLSTGRTGDSHGMVWRLEADCHPHHWAKTHRGVVTADRASRSFFWFPNGSSTIISWLGHVKPS